jgi:hypothetical protein
MLGSCWGLDNSGPKCATFFFTSASGLKSLRAHTSIPQRNEEYGLVNKYGTSVHRKDESSGFLLCRASLGRLQEQVQFTIKRATASIHPGVALRARHVGRLSPHGGSAVEKSVSTRSASFRPSYIGTTYRAVSAEIICHRHRSIQTSSKSGAPHNYRSCKVHVFELLIHPLNAEGKTISLLFQGTVQYAWLTSLLRLGPITSALFMHLELNLQYQDKEVCAMMLMPYINNPTPGRSNGLFRWRSDGSIVMYGAEMPVEQRCRECAESYQKTGGQSLIWGQCIHTTNSPPQQVSQITSVLAHPKIEADKDWNRMRRQGRGLYAQMVYEIDNISVSPHPPAGVAANIFVMLAKRVPRGKQGIENVVTGTALKVPAVTVL